MIPKTIHLTFRDKTPPPKYQKNMDAWKKLHPEWDIHYYSDNDIFLFFETYFPEFVQDLHKISVGVILADIFRYGALYILGGLYTDMDTIPLKKIPEDFLTHEAVIGYEYQPEKFLTRNLSHYEGGTLCQWTLLSSPGFPLFKKALDQCFKNLKACNFQCLSCRKVLEASGPTLLTQVAFEWKKKHPLHLLDMDVFASVNLLNGQTENSLIAHQNDGLHGWVPQVETQNLSLFSQKT